MENNDQRLLLVNDYLEDLRAGDPHAVTTYQLLTLMLKSIGKTLDDLQTTEEELAECILRGRKIAALIFLQYVERRMVNPEVATHFIAVTLRYGTKHYKEVAQFICAVAEECGVHVRSYELPSEAFDLLIRGCYWEVAQSHLQSLREFNDLMWLHQFEEIVAEADISLQEHFGIDLQYLESERKRIYDLWQNIARKALEGLRSATLDLTQSAREQHLLISMAEYQGGVSLDSIGTTDHELALLQTRSVFHENLRANARNN